MEGKITPISALLLFTLGMFLDIYRETEFWQEEIGL